MARKSRFRRLTLVLLLLGPVLAAGVLLSFIHVPVARSQGLGDAALIQPSVLGGQVSGHMNGTKFSAQGSSWVRSESRNQSRGRNSSDAPYARINVVWDNVDGWFGAGVTVWFTVTTPSEMTVKGTGSGTAGSDGWMAATPKGCRCDMVPGDHVLVSSSAGFSALLVPIEIVGLIDVAADRVSGRMSGGTFPGAGTIWAWSGNRNRGWGKAIDIAADGLYSADFAGHFDIQLGDSAEVWYLDGNGNQVGTQLEASRELQSIYLPLVKRGPH